MRVLSLGVILGLGLASFNVQAQTTFYNIQKKQEMLRTGKIAYINRCSGCHGISGKGDGPAAKMLDPKPRDFARGIFKLKSTAIGKMPTDADLLRVIDQGVPGTSMPSFALVSDSEKIALVEYIKSFAPKKFKRQSVSNVIPAYQVPRNVFTKKKTFIKHAIRGQAWFQALGCNACHGNTGLGDGPSATTDLKDAWGEKIAPGNLTMPYVKRGYSVQDVAFSIAHGVDGTPMPAHHDMLQHLDEQFPEIKNKSFIWDLTAFVFYLRGKEAGIYTNEISDIPPQGLSDEHVQKLIGKYMQ